MVEQLHPGSSYGGRQQSKDSTGLKDHYFPKLDFKDVLMQKTVWESSLEI